MQSCQLLILAACVAGALAHGRLLEPPSRASAWRAGFPTTPDFDDDGVDCGGWAHQWNVNKGKCGICGDPYDLPTPRPHELGGIFGQGVIVARYEPGSVINTTVDLTAPHWGYWEFNICPDPKDNEQECFDKYLLELEDGQTKFFPDHDSKIYTLKYRLPRGLVCEHCVLQWRYTAAHNWGTCKNGTDSVGCGNQEVFGACSDISIGGTKGVKDNSIGGTKGVKDNSIGGTKGVKDTSIGGTKGVKDNSIGGAKGVKDNSIGGTKGVKDNSIGGTKGVKDNSIGGAKGVKDNSIGGTTGVKNNLIGATKAVKANSIGVTEGVKVTEGVRDSLNEIQHRRFFYKEKRWQGLQDKATGGNAKP